VGQLSLGARFFCTWQNSEDVCQASAAEMLFNNSKITRLPLTYGVAAGAFACLAPSDVA